MELKLNVITVNLTVDYNGEFYGASLKHDTETCETEIDIYDHEFHEFIDEKNGRGKEIADKLIDTYIK
jgi:hypothetical protein